MSDFEVQMRISLINVPDDLSPLKLRSYLLEQARDIQELSAENSFIVIRLFLPDRVRFGYTPKKLDVLLDHIVNKFSKIQRIELVPVGLSLDGKQMEEATVDAEGYLQEMVEDCKQLVEGSNDPTVH